MTKTLEESVQSSESDKEAIILIGNEEVIEVDNFKLRLFKGSLVNFINFLQGWGSILLTPALLRYHNEVDDKEDPVVKGSQLLILALLFGGVKLIGPDCGLLSPQIYPFQNPPTNHFCRYSWCLLSHFTLELLPSCSNRYWYS